MYLVLRVIPAGMVKIDGVLRDIEEGILKTQAYAAPAALVLAISMLEDRFYEEGIPAWQDLALSTQRQRRVRGYDPEHPILRRSGDLFRSLTDTTDAQNIHRIRNYSKRTVGILGTKDFRYGILQEGNELEGGSIPARWMWPGAGSREEQYLMDDIEDDLTENLAENVQLSKHRSMGVR